MKTTLLTLLCLILTSSIFAQHAQITGAITEHPGNHAFPYVTVTLRDSSSKLISAAMTNDRGAFQLDAIPVGIFKLSYSFTGFTTITKTIQITSAKSVNLPAVSMIPDAKLLSEISITAERASISLKPGKKVFEVGKDILSQAGSVTDLLNIVPSVSVSASGGISLRGNSSVLVLIDGRRTGLTQSNALEQIPSERVERVEIITNPSSKFDAAGSAGIINIILKKNKKAGFSGQLRAVVGTPNETRLSPSLNYKSDRVNLFATYGIRKSDYVGVYTLQQTSTARAQPPQLQRQQDEQRHDDGRLLYFGMDYQLDKHHSFTAAFLRNATDDHDKTQLNYLYQESDGYADSTLTRRGESWEKRNYNQVEFNYTRSFKKPGQKLTVDMQYDFWNSDKRWTLRTGRTLPTIATFPAIRTGSAGATKDLIVQTDLILPLDSTSSLEFGLKLDNRKVKNHFIAEQEQETAWNTIDGIDNQLRYKEVIGSAYMQYSDRIGKISYQAGLRNEITQVDIQEAEGTYSNKKNYNRLFPTFNINFNFISGATLQGSYSKRINRPSLNLIYPFNELTDLTTRFLGNPNLNPSYADVFELSFLQSWTTLSLNPSVYYQRNNSVIQEFTYRDADGIFITTPINIDRETRQGLELSLQYKPIKWLQITAEMNVFKYVQQGFYAEQSFDYSGKTVTGRMNASIKLRNKLGFQGIYNFTGANSNAQTHYAAIHSIDGGLSKTLMKDKATILFDVTNLFELRKFDSRTEGTDYVLHQRSIPNAARYRLTLIYRLNLKENQSVRQAKGGNRN